MGIFGNSDKQVEADEQPASVTTPAAGIVSEEPDAMPPVLPTLNSYQREALYGALELSLRREGADASKINRAHFELATAIGDPSITADA